MGQGQTGGIAVRRARLGTRGSALARRQTDLVVERLRAGYPDVEFTVEIVQTEGDRVRDRPISAIGDKGVFVRAIEHRLVYGAIDLAVHSLKDVPADSQTPGLVLAAFSPREDPRDVLVSRSGERLRELPSGARIGTSSLRRRVQLRALRADLAASDIRGNVDTRLRKVRVGEYDAVILAAAGLLRLGLGHLITEYLPVEDFVPDAGQGIMAVQARAGDPASLLARSIDDDVSRAAARAERAVVLALGAGCHSPVGAYAQVEGGQMILRGMAADEEGRRLHRAVESGPAADAETLGITVARRLQALLAG